MPFGSLQVFPHLGIKSFIFYTKTWSKHPSGQIAISTGFCHSRKRSTGGFLALEISFSCPLPTALNVHCPYNVQSYLFWRNVFWGMKSVSNRFQVCYVVNHT